MDAVQSQKLQQGDASFISLDELSTLRSRFMDVGGAGRI